jgi:hypothetical protein
MTDDQARCDPFAAQAGVGGTVEYQLDPDRRWDDPPESTDQCRLRRRAVTPQ